LTKAFVFRSRGEIEAVQEAKFAETMDLVAKGHPYYRELLSRNGLSRADFRGLSDLPKLPITRKDDYMRAPDRFRLGISDLPEEMRAVWDVMYTTGSTTGQPTPFVSTSFDFFRILDLHRNMLALRAVRPDDVIANLFPVTIWPHGAFIRTLHAAASMNLRVVAALPGNPSPHFVLGSALDEVVRTIERSRATVLWGVPSYVRRVVARAEELGADFRPVRLAFVTGEGMPEAVRNDLTAAMRRIGSAAAWVSISYGSTETQGGLVECAPGSGYHNPAPDQFYFEVVDPDTHRPVEDGVPGLVLLTHLQRRGTLLMRYALGDISVQSHAQCPHCGAWTDRLVAMPRRADALVKIKGMLVNPDVLVQAAQAELGARDYQFIIGRTTPDSPLATDTLVLKLSTDTHDQNLATRLAEAIKRATGVTPEVEFVSPGAIADSAGAWKTKRVIDTRPKD
jgi:phenylacetate-coenzyme A ligase PaaK-like adenylate-forming protein